MDVQSDVFVLRAKVAELEAKLAFLYTQLNITYVPDVDALNAPVIELLRVGKLMDAIKRYRDIHQTSLTETHAAVEALKAKYKL
jgi:ribosomal protein L7/L12